MTDAQQPAQGEERERFEAFIKSNWKMSNMTRGPMGNYISPDIAACYIGWQARAALTPQIGEAVGTIRAIDEERWEFGVQWHRTDMRRGDNLYLHPAQPAEQSVDDKHERDMLKVIDERDAAEEALSQAYYLVTGESPEWSNVFGHREALADIEDAMSLLKQSVKPAEQEGDKEAAHWRSKWEGLRAAVDKAGVGARVALYAEAIAKSEVNATPKG